MHFLNRDNRTEYLMDLTFFTFGGFVRGSRAVTPGGAEEFFLTVAVDEKADLRDELDALNDAYISALNEYGLNVGTAVFSRFFISDIVNMNDMLTESAVFNHASAGAVSVIQQMPVGGGSVSMLSYHIKRNGGLKKTALRYDNDGWQHGLWVEGDAYNLLWAANFFNTEYFNSHKQTAGVFKSYNEIIGSYDMTLLDNVIRTWFYVRDIDNHYKGLLDSRKGYFDSHGLTPDTRYIASTGIEGISRDVGALVGLDALAISNLSEKQIIRMEALDHLSPTINYGGTFERGTRIRFGDRSHLYISGTASIDRNGKVVHISDIGKQTRRTLENIAALLEPHGAVLSDMAYLIVYIRTVKYRSQVEEVLKDTVDDKIPLIFVESPVCRPTWLVEMEGIGIISDSNEFPPFF